MCKCVLLIVIRVLVTHNLSYLHRVDRILVMDEGRIVEQGSSSELRANPDSAFQEIAASSARTST